MSDTHPLPTDDTVDLAPSASAVELFMAQVLREPWGTLSRSRLDHLIFDLLVAEKRIKVDESEFDIANELQTTPGRVRTLLYRYEQDAVRQDRTKLNDLLTPENIAFADKVADGKVRVQVRSKYLREYFIARLINRGSLTIREVTPTLFSAPKDAFMEELIAVGVQADGPLQEEAFSALFTTLTGVANQRDAGAKLRRVEQEYGISVVGNLVKLFGTLNTQWHALTS